MAWAAPTAADIKAKIPAMAGVDDALFSDALALAAETVPQALPSQLIFDRAFALWVAHDMTLSGHGTSPEVEVAQSGTLASVSDGATSVTRRALTGAAADNPMMLTTFGSRYVALIRQYQVPFSLVGE